MLALFAALAMAATTPDASASAAPAANAPLREVVYKVSYTDRQTKNIEAYGGYDPSGGNMGAANGGAPVSQGAGLSDEGTVTVDVMATANNALGMRVTELWRQHPRPQLFNGAVAPDGSLNFGSQPISEVSSYLLPFFGPLIANGQTLDVGVKWTVNADTPAVSATTTYEVKAVDDKGVTIQENRTVKVKGTAGMDASISGTIVYLAPKLVPISGKIERHSSRGGASETDVDDMILTFNRTSDTLDKQ